MGTELITSTPPAITRSWVPDITAWAAKCTACCAEPHCRSRVVPGTVSGSPAAEPRVPRDVASLGSDLVDTAEDDVVDGRGIHVDTVEERPEDVGPEVVGVYGAQAAASAADGGADGFDDERFRHEGTPTSGRRQVTELNLVQVLGDVETTGLPTCAKLP